MAKEIKIPRISEGVDTATVAEILVSEGDQIEEEQSVIAVETDKATADVPAEISGIVKEIKVSAGDEVKVGDTVIVLEEEEEGSESEGEGESEDESGSESEDKGEDKSEGEEEKEENGKKSSSKSDGAKEKQKVSSDKKSSDEDVYASPGVRRLARELEIDLAEVKGSGEDGRITKQDLENHQSAGGKEKVGNLSELPDFSKWGSVERKKLNNIKKTTAKNVTASWQHIPHVFQFAEADISDIEDYIEKYSDKVENAGGKLTITAVLTKIVALALRQFPEFNASYDANKEELILKKYVNISIAVATEQGLLVPVIKDVDVKSLKEVSVEITELAEKARNQSLKKEDMEGGNFSISNLGGIGGTNFTPIIYHPQVAILGVSQATAKAVYREGKFKPRNILPLCLSYDHRVIDGAEAAALIDWIVKALADPYEALLH
ncbi:MAG: 2-oxo acid dehydrogenase subunit E2 [Brumimicrobium sp.]|nr:2-oxo acid dehydrogenase subunit E2 [Brumimicrobium sp.]